MPKIFTRNVNIIKSLTCRTKALIHPTEFTLITINVKFNSIDRFVVSYLRQDGKFVSESGCSLGSDEQNHK